MKRKRVHVRFSSGEWQFLPWAEHTNLGLPSIRRTSEFIEQSLGFIGLDTHLLETRVNVTSLKHEATILAADMYRLVDQINIYGR